MMGVNKFPNNYTNTTYATHKGETLADTLQEMRESKANNCKVCDVVDVLSESDAETLEEYITHEILPLTTIVDALAKHHYAVSETTLRRHKRKCLGL